MKQPKNGLFMNNVHYSCSSTVNIPMAKMTHIFSDLNLDVKKSHTCNFYTPYSYELIWTHE